MQMLGTVGAIAGTGRVCSTGDARGVCRVCSAALGLSAQAGTTLSHTAARLCTPSSHLPPAPAAVSCSSYLQVLVHVDAPVITFADCSNIIFTYPS